jgi:hypothetical protein
MQTLVAEMVNSDNSMRQQVAAIPQALGHPVVTLFLHEYTAMNTSQWQIMNLMMEARRRLFNRHRLSFQRLRVVNREEHVAARVLAAWQRGVPQQHQQQHQQ